MGEAKEAYERILGRVAELEVDLGRTVAALQQSTDDNSQLRSLHDDVQYSYDRMREKYELVRLDLRTERDQRLQLEREFQDQMQEWHTELEGKSRELDELHNMQPAREIEMLRLKLVEEISEPYEAKLKAVNGKLQIEQRKAVDAKRVLEMEKLEREQEAVEHKRAMTEIKTAMKVQQDVLSKQVVGLEEDNHKLMESNAALQVLRTQIQEYHSKCKHFQGEIDDLVASNRAEVDELTRTVTTGHNSIEKLKREKRQLECEKERLKRELYDSQRQISIDSERVNTFASEITGLKMELHDSKNSQRAVVVPNTEELSDMRAQIAALEKEVSVKTREVQLLQERRPSTAPVAPPKVEKSATISARLRDETERYRTTLAEKEANLRQVKAECEGEMEQCKIDRAKACAEVKALKEKLQEADMSMKQVQAQVGECERTIRTQEAEFDTSRAQLRAAEQKVRDVEEAHTQTNAKLVAAKHELDLCAVRAEQLVAQRESTQRALEHAQVRCDEDKAHHNEVVKEVSGKAQHLKKVNRELKTKLRAVVEKLQEAQLEKTSVLQVCDENRHKYELYMSEMRNSLNGGVGSDILAVRA